mmetsp:Transcript_1886/g.2615  ORF Transcript_1886/g.2615 Transcript_1886/m.2615 type:complete len:238 (+) Transcript_1886:677-1390(+)|eukprot:CAMPEP_0170500528 /NCGR_PEP_ID=MMETSP0208-20121228/35169_1 /TAXON_ID=197538 /ORGANISM="Strombidium inclinatum, Strain S3" /LENGTH=237 /DNA_ID=CAMNT_0010778611 /DNA_START=619 /DNA_END=1332 /DNA_ORIENTATION=+
MSINKFVQTGSLLSNDKANATSKFWIDESGRLIKHLVSFDKDDTFTLSMFLQQSDRLEFYRNYMAKVQFFGGKYSFKTGDFLVTSVGSDHLEVVHFIADPLPISKNLTNSSPDSISIETTNFVLPGFDLLKDEGRMFTLSEGSLLTCRDLRNFFQYNSTLCDLTKEIDVGDLLVFTHSDRVFASEAKRFILPNIIELADSQLNATMSIGPQNEFLEDEELKPLTLTFGDLLLGADSL